MTLKKISVAIPGLQISTHPLVPRAEKTQPPMIDEDTTGFKRNGSHGRARRHLEMKQHFFASRAIDIKYFYLVTSGSDPFLDQGPAWIFSIDEFFERSPLHCRLPPEKYGM